MKIAENAKLNFNRKIARLRVQVRLLALLVFFLVTLRAAGFFVVLFAAAFLLPVLRVFYVC